MDKLKVEKLREEIRLKKDVAKNKEIDIVGTKPTQPILSILTMICKAQIEDHLVDCIESVPDWSGIEHIVLINYKLEDDLFPNITKNPFQLIGEQLENLVLFGIPFNQFKNKNIKFCFYRFEELDFSEIANVTKSFASGFFCLKLDGDERLRISKRELLEIQNMKLGDAGLVVCWSGLGTDYEGKNPSYYARNCLRVFRNMPFINFIKGIHETVEYDIVENGFGIKLSTIGITHIGYLSTAEEQQRRYARNLPLCAKEVWKNPNDRAVVTKLYDTLKIVLGDLK